MSCCETTALVLHEVLTSSGLFQLDGQKRNANSQLLRYCSFGAYNIVSENVQFWPDSTNLQYWLIISFAVINKKMIKSSYLWETLINLEQWCPKALQSPLQK